MCASIGIPYDSVERTPTFKRQTSELYLESLWVRLSGHFLKCSPVSVHHRIKAFSESIETYSLAIRHQNHRNGGNAHLLLGRKKFLLDAGTNKQ